MLILKISRIFAVYCCFDKQAVFLDVVCGFQASVRHELGITKSKRGAIFTGPLKTLPVWVRAKWLANISLAPGWVSTLIQKGQSDLSFKRPFQKRVVLARKEPNVHWKMRPLAAAISEGKHHDFKLVSIRTGVKWRAVQFYAVFVFRVFKFLPKVIHSPVKLTIGERFAMFNNFS